MALYTFEFCIQLGADNVNEARKAVAKYLGVPVEVIKKHLFYNRSNL